MLEIYLSNSTFLIFDINIYKTLREQHRIVAKLCGSANDKHSPDSLYVCNLPAVLVQEQARYLSVRGVAQVYDLGTKVLNKKKEDPIEKDAGVCEDNNEAVMASNCDINHKESNETMGDDKQHVGMF